MARTLHVFTFPERLAKEVGYKSVGIVELTAEEQLMASARSKADPIRVAYELAKESLRAVDDTAISAVDGSVDKVWANLNPKAMNLIIRAFNDIHNPTPEDMDSFLSSKTVRV